MTPPTRKHTREQEHKPLPSLTVTPRTGATSQSRRAYLLIYLFFGVGGGGGGADFQSDYKKFHILNHPTYIFFFFGKSLFVLSVKKFHLVRFLQAAKVFRGLCLVFQLR